MKRKEYYTYYDYLKGLKLIDQRLIKKESNKDIYYVPSGGKGNDEVIAEAEAIKNYLIEQGISKTKIIIEDKSKSTQENMKFSKKISEMTNGAISQINIFNDIQGKINNSNNTIDAMKKELENKKKQIELYLTEQVNTAIDGAKKEVENRLKDSISNDVKDKFLNLGKGKF